MHLLAVVLGNFSLSSVFSLLLMCFDFYYYGLGRLTCCFRTHQKYVMWFLDIQCVIFASAAWSAVALC